MGCYFCFFLFFLEENNFCNCEFGILTIIIIIFSFPSWASSLDRDSHQIGIYPVIFSILINP